MKYRNIFISLICLAIPFTGMAQDPDHRRTDSHRETIKPEVKAKQEADEWQVELDLDQKQYKKVYKLLLAEEQERSQSRSGFGRQGPPPGGRREGGPPPSRSGEFSSERPEGFRRRGAVDLQQMQEAAEKKEKKMKKILTSEQFDRWTSLEKEKTGKRLP